MAKALWIGIIIVIILAVAAVTFFSQPAEAGQYDAFAMCLTDNGAKMFGAYWCHFCDQQKKSFGDSWKYVSYIECSTPDGRGQTQACISEGVQSYPTWEFADSSRQTGVLSFEQLSQKTGCALPA